MATVANHKDRIRINLDVSPELKLLLERLAQETGATQSDVLRKAIVLMEVAVEAKQSGQKLYVGEAAPPGQSREIIGI